MIPNASTENVYKFFALSGVAMLLASGHWHVTKVAQFSEVLLERHDELQRISQITQGGAAIGAVLALSGFAAWFFRVQLPADREARAQSELAVLQAKEALMRLESAKPSASR
jgi:hypothetical protein